MNLNSKPRMILRKKRDFGEAMNAIFEFLNLNQRDLYRAIVFIVCPIGLVGGIAAGMINFSLADNFANMYGGPDFLSIFTSFPFWISIVSVVIGYNAVISVSMVYIKKYLNKEDDLSVPAIWEEVKKYIMPIFAMQFLSGFLLIGAYVVSILVLTLVGSIAWPLAVLGFFGMLIFMLYLASNLFMIYPVLIIEEVEFFAAFSRAFSLVQNHFWTTALLFFVLFVVYSSIGMVFYIPAYMVETVVAMHWLESDSIIFQLIKILANIMSSIGGYLVLPVLMLGPAFQLFNLVEHKESRGLLERIDAFGVREEQIDEETY